MILVYSAVLSAYVYTYVALHIGRCLKCILQKFRRTSSPDLDLFGGIIQQKQKNTHYLARTVLSTVHTKKYRQGSLQSKKREEICYR